MGQIKIYGLKDNLNNIRGRLSDTIHSCIVDVFQLPEKKRFHRFFPMERENFIFPNERSEKYTIIEISIFEGRSVEAKKKLISLLFKRIEKELDILPMDVEITIFETPEYNWGIRGLPGDELNLDYNIRV